MTLTRFRLVGLLLVALIVSVLAPALAQTEPPTIRCDFLQTLYLLMRWLPK